MAPKGSDSHAGIYVNLEPVVGAILGVCVLHEKLGIVALVGGALIVGAAVYFSCKPATMVAVDGKVKVYGSR